MSLNNKESLREGTNIKRSTSPIRKYFSTKPSSTTTTTTTKVTTSAPIKKPLTSPNDNIEKNTTKLETPKDTDSKTKPSLQQMSFYDFNLKYQRKANATAPSTPTNEIRPPTLKRSHSAISHLDTANETWMNSPLISKQKTYDNKTFDRLAPRITDMPSAQVMMSKSAQTDSILDSQGSDSYREKVAEAIGLDPSKRILTFTAATPTSKHANLSMNARQTKLITQTSTKSKRYILSTPEKILDAPYMADDYYLNVLDWSKNNVVAVGLGNSIYLWNADNGTIQALNYDYDDAVASVAWSGDGTYLSVGTTKGDTQIWDVQSNTKLRSMTGQDCRIGVLSWDKHLVSSGGRNGSIFHHDVRMAKHTVNELYGHADEVCGLKWRWDGQLLASGGNDNTVNIWDARSTVPKFTKRNHTGAIKALAWCPWNRNLLATGGGRDDKKIHFWSTTTGVRVNTIHAGAQVTSLAWSTHYREIASTHGSPHNQVTVWGYPNLNKIIDIPAHDTRILHSALSPDGQVLATAAADENLKFWRLFESDGRAALASESARLTAKKEVQIRRSKTLR